MNNTNYDNVWYSGDWKQQNNNKVPYNGLQIKATANYSLPTSPPSTQNLVSVDIEVVDYTYDPKGVSSHLILTENNTWYDIPIPENTEISPPEPNADFTVRGIDNDSLGKLQLFVTTSGIYLNIEFSYGPTTNGREELGFIMKINSTYQEGQDPIQVSGQ